jgi:beta-xylosidase
MTFGSFWDGIYRVQIDPATGHRLAGRPGMPRHMAQRVDGVGDAIEAPYVYERDGSFYLFVNWDSCCNGVNSTYNIRVGRSESITGPFVDRDGVSLQNGGGTLVLATEGNFIGPGHAAIFTDEGIDWFGYHYYDGNAGGASRYNHRTIYWDSEGWPVIGGIAPIPGDYNNDGTVNAADYVLYRNLSETESLLPNRNPALNGPIGQDDYDFWLANFGNSFANAAGLGTAAVPEPASGALVLLVVVGMSGFRWRP